ISRLLVQRNMKQQVHEPVRINGQPIFDDTASLSALDTLDETALFPNKNVVKENEVEAHTAPTEIVNLLGDSTKPPENGKVKPAPVINISSIKNSKSKAEDLELQPLSPSPLGYIWNLPPLNLLEISGEAKVSQADLKMKIKVIEEALQSFNV